MAAMQIEPNVANVAASKSIELYRPIDADGITFLPATYVPAAQTESILDQIGRGVGPKSQMGRA